MVAGLYDRREPTRGQGLGKVLLLLGIKCEVLGLRLLVCGNRQAIIVEEGEVYLRPIKDQVLCTRCKCRGQSEVFVGKAEAPLAVGCR